ncbi:MAG: hypothetical protein ACYTXC_12320 [Nostoc sp.]
MQSREGLLKYILESLKMQVPTPCDLDHFSQHYFLLGSRQTG